MPVKNPSMILTHFAYVSQVKRRQKALLGPMVLITSCSFVEYQLRKAGETGYDLTMLYFERDLS